MLNVIKNILTACAAAAAVFLFIFVITGNRIYAVRSGSMEPSVPTGAVAFVETFTEIEDVQTGDIIVFEAANGTPVIHRAAGIYDDGIETKGDANKTSDGISTTKENYIGKTVFTVPLVGYALVFLSSARAKIIIITSIAVLVILTIYKNKYSGKENKRCERNLKHQTD